MLPLAWLAVARTWGAVPAPGLVSANFFLRAGVAEPLPPAADEHPAAGRGDAERLRAASFWRLLLVYPGARLFWPLVVCALALSVTIHIAWRRQRRRIAGAVRRRAPSRQRW